ncbi:hypothetical protein [Marinobacter gelidimuriae]|uniref:hypothetical protein n=1 Tax=Marinobacter gelidimuriae TaxID=2739064 RepID=UPI002B4002A1|nr:hypothetical protein [Marinobacter gelidimuriae]
MLFLICDNTKPRVLSNTTPRRRIEQQRATTHDVLMARLDEVIELDGEGLMLHRGNSLYRAGRSDDVLKVKRYQDAEAVVVGYSPGEGKYDGMLGALRVERPDGRQFKLGSGLSDVERASPPAIGATVTYKFFGHTSTGCRDLPALCECGMTSRWLKSDTPVRQRLRSSSPHALTCTLPGGAFLQSLLFPCQQPADGV